MGWLFSMIKKITLYPCHFKTNGYLCIKEGKIIAIEIKAIPTLEGHVSLWLKYQGTYPIIDWGDGTMEIEPGVALPTNEAVSQWSIG